MNVDAPYRLYFAEMSKERGMQIAYFKYVFIFSHVSSLLSQLGVKRVSQSVAKQIKCEYRKRDCRRGE